MQGHASVPILDVRDWLQLKAHERFSLLQLNIKGCQEYLVISSIGDHFLSMKQ